MSKASKIIAYILIGLMLVLILVLDISSSRKRRNIECSRISIEVRDSAELGFIRSKDVKNIIDKEYGDYLGVKIDSIDLKKIETILESKSSILECEAYVTNDGSLNISIKEREPVIRLLTQSGAYFIDETGFLFPANSNYDKPLTEIEGLFSISHKYSGKLETPKQRYWLENLLKMMKYMESEKTWSDGFEKITADRKGNIILKPKVGKEKFYFGPPDDYEKKFEKIKDYYRYIVNLKGEGYYKSVNVKNKGQIVCK